MRYHTNDPLPFEPPFHTSEISSTTHSLLLGNLALHVVLLQVRFEGLCRPEIELVQFELEFGSHGHELHSHREVEKWPLWDMVTPEQGLRGPLDSCQKPIDMVTSLCCSEAHFLHSWFGQHIVRTLPDFLVEPDPTFSQELFRIGVHAFLPSPTDCVLLQLW